MEDPYSDENARGRWRWQPIDAAPRRYPRHLAVARRAPQTAGRQLQRRLPPQAPPRASACRRRRCSPARAPQGQPVQQRSLPPPAPCVSARRRDMCSLARARFPQMLRGGSRRIPAASAFGAQTDGLSPTALNIGKICPFLGTLRTAAQCRCRRRHHCRRRGKCGYMHANFVVKFRSELERI